jgi:hypothetical protein
MMDALGFKALSQREPEALLRKLHTLEAAARTKRAEFEAAADRLRRHGWEQRIRIAFLSDTIAIGVAFTAVNEDGQNDIFALTTGALIASHVLGRAGAEPTPLAYRGCLAYGDFDIDGNFLAGKAVNEAAEACETAEAAVVWLAPSAKPILDTVENPENTLAFRGNWRVPLKGGQSYRTHTVNPFGDVLLEHRSAWCDRVVGTFSGSLSVEVKKENTRAFLERMKDALERRIYPLAEY